MEAEDPDNKFNIYTYALAGTSTVTTFCGDLKYVVDGGAIDDKLTFNPVDNSITITASDPFLLPDSPYDYTVAVELVNYP